MPELPEVERARTVAESVALGRRIVDVTCARDPIVFEGAAPVRFKRALVGRHVTAVGRRGKHFWLELDDRPWPCFHLGMAGAVRSPGHEPLALASDGRRTDPGWPPRHAKIRIRLDDGGDLVMTDKRRFARVRLRENPLDEPPIAGLGFDPLLDLPAPAEFARLLRSRSAIVKALLLDQSFAAGVGNWIADEVLYQAGIDPRRRASSLSDAEARRVRSKLRHVVGTAVRVGAAKSRFPRSWLFHHRWGRQADARTARGERIEHL
ncbi:MAG: DNA-formamidopyrimidine glycosylase family protein, partial [Planctomycetota bacterium]